MLIPQKRDSWLTNASNVYDPRGDLERECTCFTEITTYQALAAWSSRQQESDTANEWVTTDSMGPYSPSLGGDTNWDLSDVKTRSRT